MGARVACAAYDTVMAMDERPDDDGYFAVSRPRDPGEELTPPPGVGRPVRTGPSIATVMATILGAALLVGAGLVWALAGTREPVASTDPDGPGTVRAETPGDPAALRDPTRDGFLVWARNDDGTPVRWNPCEPIHYVLNRDGAPAGAEVDLAHAASLVTSASGIRFAFDGVTDETPGRERSPYQPERYGERWAPVLVAWSSPDATDVPLIASDRGVSIPVAVGGGGEDVFVSAQVVLNPDRDLAPGFADRSGSWGATILHELGHVVGLDHVDDPGQVMFTFPGEGPVRFGGGDLSGLREVGAGGCVSVPEPVDVDVTFAEDFG